MRKLVYRDSEKEIQRIVANQHFRNVKKRILLRKQMDMDRGRAVAQLRQLEEALVGVKKSNI